MNELGVNPETITGQTYLAIFRILEDNPAGVRWVDLLAKVAEEFPEFHPKTINGCVWKLVEKFPQLVHKPEKGLFQLLRYKV